MPARLETPLKRILEDEGRSQAWLARRLAVTRQQVWMWTNGIHAPEHATRERIADILGRTTDELWPDEPAELAA